MSATPTWLALLRARIRTLPLLKASGNAVFLVVFFYLYLYIQRNPWFGVTQIPATAIDRWMGFHPQALGLYLSLWVYTALPVALLPDRQALMRFGAHIGLMCGIGLVIFVIWPTSVSDAVGLRAGTGGAFDAMYRVDTNGNACPSLHVAAALFSQIWLRAQLREVGAPSWLHLANTIWCVGIVVSTMAIKQHLLLDVLAGAILGAVAGTVSVRRAAAASAAVQ